MLQRILVLSFLVFTASLPVFAQENVTTFGIQIKPIVPSNLLNAGTEGSEVDGIQYNVEQRMGYSFGGVVRRGLTRWLTIESGISYVRRNYRASVMAASDGFSDSTRFRVIGYEVPVLGLVYVRLGDKIFMDAAFGLSLDFFPSNVGSGPSTDFYQHSFYRNKMQTSLLANVGWELRTEDKGYFYVGASFHRPFSPIYVTQIHYDYNGAGKTGSVALSGNYLTLDLRYFFHEEPEVRERKKKRKQEDMPLWMRKR